MEVINLDNDNIMITTNIMNFKQKYNIKCTSKKSS